MFIRINDPNFFLLVLAFELTSLVQFLGFFKLFIPMWSSWYWVLFKTFDTSLVLGPRPNFGWYETHTKPSAYHWIWYPTSIYYICDSTSGPYHVGTQGWYCFRSYKPSGALDTKVWLSPLVRGWTRDHPPHKIEKKMAPPNLNSRK